MIDQVNTMASMVDCEFCNFAVAGDVPPVKLQRLQSCNVIATWDGLKEPIETHTCKGINVYALHDTSANIAVECVLLCLAGFTVLTAPPSQRNLQPARHG